MNCLHAAALIAVLFSAPALVTTAAASEPTGKPVIQSAQGLARFLAESAPAGSALDAMPVGARKRFLAQLRFGARGLGGFGMADLQDTLTHAQIIQVLALFGLDQYSGQLRGLATIRAPRDFESDFELRFDAFNAALDLPSRPDDGRIATSYRDLMAGNAPVELARTLDSYDLALLFRAMLRVLQTDSVLEAAAQSTQVLAVLRSQGEATPNRVGELFDTLVSLRKFHLADQIAREYPESGVAELPHRTFAGGTDAGLNAMLKVSADGRLLSRDTLDLARGLHIVVVAGCHFAKDAAIAISADPGVNRLFQSHGVWLAPASERISDVAEWNRQLPSQPIQIAWRERDWLQIPSWNMPTFYIFRDGALVTQWSGWPSDSGMKSLLLRLHDAGVKF